MSKDLSAFADQFIIVKVGQIVKDFFVKNQKTQWIYLKVLTVTFTETGLVFSVLPSGVTSR